MYAIKMLYLLTTLKASKMFSCRFYSIICFFNQNKPSDQSNRSNFSHGTLVLEHLMCKSTTSEKDSLALASPRLPSRHADTGHPPPRREYTSAFASVLFGRSIPPPPPAYKREPHLRAEALPFFPPPLSRQVRPTFVARRDGQEKGGKKVT